MEIKAKYINHGYKGWISVLSESWWWKDRRLMDIILGEVLDIER